MKTRALDRWVALAKHEASSVMSVLGAPKFTGGTPMEVDMERLQRTIQWLAIRKEAGLKLVQRLLKLNGATRRPLTLTGSTQTCRSNVSKSAENTSPALLQAMCGSIFVTCPKRSETPCRMFCISGRTAVFRQHP